MTRTNTNNPNNPLKFEVRRVQQQTDGRSYSVVIPNRFSRKMRLQKGDLMKIHLENDRLLISEKLDLDGVANDTNTATEIGGV